MKPICNQSMVSYFYDSFRYRKPNLSLGLFLLTLVLAFFLIADITLTITSVLSIQERIALHVSVLFASLFWFIIFFWRETGGDFFSFINITLMSYLMMFALPAFINLYVPNAFTKPNYWDSNSAELSLLLLIVALYSLVLGYTIAIRKCSGMVLSFSVRPSVRRISIVVFGCVIMWLFYYCVKSLLIGVAPWHFLGYYTRGNEILQSHRTGVFALLDFFNRGAYYIFLLCLLLPRDQQIKKSMIVGANLYILFYILNTMITGVFMTAKSTIFTVFFIIICFVHYNRGRITPRKLAIAAVICVFVVVLFNFQRTNVDWRREHSSVSDIIREAPRMYIQTFEDFEVFSATVYRFPQFQPHYNGRRLFEEVFYTPLPRFFWKGKPVEYGSRAILYDIEPWFFTTGYCAGPHSQFYADFGLVGIVIGFGIFGWLIGWVYNTFRRNCPNKGVVIFYTLIILNTWLYFKGGFPWLNLILVVYIPFYILLWCIYPRHVISAENKIYA